MYLKTNTLRWKATPPCLCVGLGEVTKKESTAGAACLHTGPATSAGGDARLSPALCALPLGPPRRALSLRVPPLPSLYPLSTPPTLSLLSPRPPVPPSSQPLAPFPLARHRLSAPQAPSPCSPSSPRPVGIPRPQTDGGSPRHTRKRLRQGNKQAACSPTREEMKARGFSSDHETGSERVRGWSLYLFILGNGFRMNC